MSRREGKKDRLESVFQSTNWYYIKKLALKVILAGLLEGSRANFEGFHKSQWDEARDISFWKISTQYLH